MMTYEDTTRSNPISEPIIPFFASAGSLPELAAKINISHDTISAIVTNVPINIVAESMMSWTKRPTEVGSHLSLTLFLMPSVS